MSLIDQRILIIAPIEAIWTHVATPTLMPKWNQACKQISVLTTKPNGVGARRRIVGDNGKAVVEEITAWLENFGYEYRVVDGPFESFRGRFRLQAVAEGTVVNWTVEYRLRGPMSGLRNLATFRRHQSDLMAESLRQLRRVVEASGAHLDLSEHARFAMQSGPSVEARAAWTVDPANLPSQPVRSETAALKPIDRPVDFGDDDMPEMPAAPMPAVQPARRPGTGPLRPIAPDFVPSFAEAGATAPAPAASDKTDTKPRAPQGLQEAVARKDSSLAKARSESRPQRDAQRESPEEAALAQTVPISMVAPPRVPEPLPDTQTVEVQTPTPPDTLPERIPTSPMPAIQDTDSDTDRQNFNPAVPTDKRDTGEVSIWDVFGVARPSERAQAELEAVIASIQRRAESPDAPEAQATEPIGAIPRYIDVMLPARRDRKASAPVRMMQKHGSHLKVEVAVRRPGKRKL